MAALVAALATAPALGAGGRPRAAIVDGPPPETVETEATIAFAATGQLPGARYLCAVDGAAFAPCASPLRLAGLATGEHRVAVRLEALLADPDPDVRVWKVLDRVVVTPPVVRPDRPQAGVPARGCRDGATRLARLTAREAGTAVTCVITAERRRRGLAALRPDARLRAAGTRHARDMVRRRFYAHRSPGGSTVLDRVRATGWASGARRYAVGEVLVWFRDPSATPAAVVRAWMGSPPHRRVLLDGSLRDVGAGVAAGTPEGHTRGMTFAFVLGRRA